MLMSLFTHYPTICCRNR